MPYTFFTNVLISVKKLWEMTCLFFVLSYNAIIYKHYYNHSSYFSKTVQ